MTDRRRTGIVLGFKLAADDSRCPPAGQGQGLAEFFGHIVVPTEKITEIRSNKKRIVERKTYPGYIVIQMELNEKTVVSGP